MTNNKMHNTLLASAMVAGGLILSAAPAHATTFTGFDTLEFVVGSENPPIGPGSFVSVTTTELQWFDTLNESDPHSFLRILSPANSAVDIEADAGWFQIAQLQHENNVIPGTFNFSVQMNDAYKLTGATFDLTGTDMLPNIPLLVNFTETLNATPCPFPNPVGSTCDDIWQIQGLGSVLGDFRFSALETSWVLSFRILPEIDSGTALIGDTIYTHESATSNIFVEASIRRVPEPGTLALLGLGLLGLPLAARRAAKKKA